jgi:hypothetical protein
MKKVKGLKRSVSTARQWLETANPHSKEGKSMRELGLWLCDQARLGLNGNIGVGGDVLKLPRMSRFVGLDRSELLKLAEDITVRSKRSVSLTPLERDEWTRLLGAMAISNAKAGDVVVVAAMVRVAARLDLQGNWLLASQHFLLAQQQPDGSFGMLAAEMEFLRGKKRANELATLRLTVEVLWALAELAASNRRGS